MIKSLSEKKGGTRMLNKDSSTFQAFTENLKLVDSDSKNGLFTWNNKREGEAQAASKLDRFLVSKELMLMNNEITTRILPFGGSDHWTIQLEIKGLDSPRNRPFRFENIWLAHSDLLSNTKDWWSEDLHIQESKMFLLHKRLKHIKSKLKDWNRKEFGNIFVNKKVVESKIQIINQKLIQEGFNYDINEQSEKLHHEWENLCKQEEIFWRQKSRVQWLKEGERNTSIFHRSTMANKAFNRISTIRDKKGDMQNTHKEIEKVLVQHFQDIAQENIPNKEDSIREITRYIPKLVSREDNFNLNKPVSEEEVSKVLKDL